GAVGELRWPGVVVAAGVDRSVAFRRPVRRLGAGLAVAALAAGAGLRPALRPAWRCQRDVTALRARVLMWQGGGDIVSPPPAVNDPSSAAAVEQLASDQHAPDLVGARTNRIELGVAQDAAGGVLVDVAVAAQRLDRLQRDLH